MRRVGLIVLAVALVACGGNAPDSGKLRIAVSILPHAWLVKTIDPEVEVVTLVGPGESPATYQPTDRQVSEVMRSAVWFRTGVPFEKGDWRTAIGESKTVKVVDLREGIELRHLAHHHHEGHACSDSNDPHIWLSPKLLMKQAETIAARLDETDPDGVARRVPPMMDLLSALAALDEAIEQILEPHSGKAVFVFHPSWGYFLEAYGLRQVPIELEGKVPSESELTKLIQRARADEVKVIFVQPQIAGQSAKAIADAVGAKVVVIDPLAEDVVGNLEKVAKEIAAALR
jgi:zinc transport system substrate-binding protein